MSEYEEACDEKPNQGCDWVSEDFIDENGDIISWESYCFNCYRYRNWGKDEYKKINEIINAELTSGWQNPSSAPKE